MESIFLKRSDIANLKRIKYDSNWILYKMDNDTLLKCFNVKEKSEEEKSVFLNTKGNKINYIANYDMPENNFKAFVFVDGRLIGYTFENVYKQGYRKLTYLDYKSNSKKLDILKKTKEHISSLNNVGISYGNITTDNILYNPTKDRILLSNMDDAKVRSYDFDVKNFYITEYLKRNTKSPMLLDNYMLNIETVTYLGNLFYPTALEYLKTGKLPEELNNQTNSRIVKEMIDLNNDYSGKLLLDHQNPVIRKRTK